jgi:hypothetical protein
MFKNMSKRGKRYGKCYTFNSGYDLSNNKISVLKRVRPGSPYGLQLKAYVGKPDTQPFWVTNMGVVISVHNQNETPLIIEEGVPIRPGAETNLILNKQESKRLPYPYSDCISSDSESNLPFYKTTLKVTETYIQNICLNECMKLSKDTSNTTFFMECLNKCPIECVSVSYKTNSFSSAFPNDEFAKMIMSYFNRNRSQELNFNNIDEVKKSVLAVNIYYDSKEYTQIVQKPLMTYDLLLANLGGQLGLFLGLDVLSFVEVFEFVYFVIKLCIRKKLEFSRKQSIASFKVHEENASKI